MRTKLVAVATTLVLVACNGAAFAEAPAATAQPERGEQLYGEFCSSCHGKYGRGDGPLAADLKQPLPDFTDSARYAGRTDEDIAKGLMAASHGPMSVASILKPEALKAAITYIRKLSTPGKHVSVLAGRDIYNAAGCWGCHGQQGDGHGPVSEALVDTKPRDFTSPKFVVDGHEEEIARSISLGAEKAIHGSKYMPEWSSRLTPQQIRDVVEYIGTFKKH
ncbi:MAG: c-type cytochrome [Deltaproteobacteria bacterium]|nr:c-type cytochrome [Deltaproteobacteria bacterium]